MIISSSCRGAFSDGRVTNRGTSAAPKLVSSIRLGTTFVVSLAKGLATNVIARHRFDTTTPERTLQEAIDWLASQSPINPVAIGIAIFGPINLDIANVKQYGLLGPTPKLAWRSFNIVEFLRQQLPADIPIGLSSDTNAAALAEQVHGGHVRAINLVYITVGTGVGIGICINGRPLTGVSHPEAGHMRVVRFPGDHFAGICPLHGDCLEGLVSAPSIAARLNINQEDLKGLSDDDPVWRIVGFYLGELCATLTLVLSTSTIIIGGGVLKRSSLLELIRRRCETSLVGYVDMPNIQRSSFKEGAGVVGALQIAIESYHNQRPNQ